MSEKILGDSHYRRLEAMYRDAPANAYWRPTLAVRHGEAEVCVTVRPDFHHPLGAAHGVTYFKALDDATFFAVNSLIDHFVLTVSFNLYILRPVSAGVLRAVGKVVSSSRRLFVADGVAYDGQDREIARCSGTFMPSAVALADIGVAGRN